MKPQSHTKVELTKKESILDGEMDLEQYIVSSSTIFLVKSKLKGTEQLRPNFLEKTNIKIFKIY